MTTRELQTCTFDSPGASKTPPKFHEKTPRERKITKMRAGEGKKSEILGGPAEGRRSRGRAVRRKGGPAEGFPHNPNTHSNTHANTHTHTHTNTHQHTHTPMSFFCPVCRFLFCPECLFFLSRFRFFFCLDGCLVILSRYRSLSLRTGWSLSLVTLSASSFVVIVLACAFCTSSAWTLRCPLSATSIVFHHLFFSWERLGLLCP